MDKNFFKNNSNKKQFIGGKEDWKNAKQVAENCKHFILDDEDEIIADDLVSCYNCRYRRWTSKTFTCQKR